MSGDMERAVKDIIREEERELLKSPFLHQVIRNTFREDVETPDARGRAVIRKIVREEMRRGLVVEPFYKPGTFPSPRPKTDLERAAEIAKKSIEWAEQYGARSTGTFQEGYRNASTYIEAAILGLQPSPDWEAQATRWRKIAEGLERVVRGPFYSDHIYLREKALAAYDATVKETSLDTSRSKEAQ